MATVSSIYEQLRNCLITCEFSPGQRLSPDALASRFGTSLSPIREALHQLASEGFVERIPNQGTFVRQLSRQQLSDLIEVREVLECHAVVVAARRCSEDELHILQTQIKNLATAYDQLLDTYPKNSDGLLDLLQAIAEADFGFHLSLFHAAGNAEVISILRNNHAMVQMFGFRTDSPESWDQDYEQHLRTYYNLHCQIYDAIAARKPREARRAMVSHNKYARTNLLNRFDAINKGQAFGDNAPQGEFSRSFREQIENKLIGKGRKKESPGNDRSGKKTN